MKTKTPKPDNPAQSKKFIEAAKALEAAGELNLTEGAARFEDTMRKIMRPKKDSA